MTIPYSLALPCLQQRLAIGALTPTQIARDVIAEAARDSHHTWIHLLPEEAVLAQAQRLEANPKARSLPLYGVPFAVKDNIDVAGHPTTAACPAYSYIAKTSATAVERLLAAGAILIGKTNLDQFATGLVGTRSPYGACSNAFDERYISGGSSSGSALAVALNQVSFTLGTDTAGSGRIPAGFNNVVGLKPTPGAVSCAGVVPACRTLDCVSVFAFTAGDAWDVYSVIRGPDAADDYSRQSKPPVRAPQTRYRCGVPRPEQLQFYGDAEARRSYERAVELLERSGATVMEVDYAPFLAAGRLLYEGPWVAERLNGIKAFYATHADEIHPTTRQIIATGANYTACDLFEAGYALAALRRKTERQFRDIDVLAVPTAPTIYTMDQIAEKPIELNANLGYYSNYANLLNLAAIAVPGGMRGDGLPAGITLIGPADSDALLCDAGDRLHRLSSKTIGATRFLLPAYETSLAVDTVENEVLIAVVGAHLRGFPLNGELIEHGARFVATARTARRYHLYLLPNSVPPKPGLVRDERLAGYPIELELWSMPCEQFGSFVACIPSPLAIGSVALEDGSTVKGFLCESAAVIGARDISSYGGWKNYTTSGQLARVG